MIQELHILVGLPGCGKTTWATKFKAELETTHSWIFSRVHLIHCDEKWVMPTKDHRYVVVDGLFSTQADIENCVAKLNRFSIKEIFIHRWNDDIDSCIWNDKGRRTKSSEATIRSLKIFDPAQVAFSFPVTVVYHTVVKKRECLLLPIPKTAEVIYDKYLVSDAWTTGGAYCDWSGSGSFATENPTDFVELEELLISINVNFPFLIYKKIWRECVSIDSKTETDYYSTIHKSFYRCDLDKLYQILKSFHLL